MTQIEHAVGMLCDLIALTTVNPMGKPYAGPSIERPVVEYLERLFSPFDVPMKRVRCGEFHESLLVEIPGQTSLPATLFESHIDTVPADDWSDRAFRPRLQDSKVFGRGACDDKGSLVAMTAAILELLESGLHPPQPIWFLAAGDEEYRQSGIKHFVDSRPGPIGRAIFGEPTLCMPIIQHKGTIRWDLTVFGRSAHTSQSELGRSAILDATKVIEHLAEYQKQLRRRYQSTMMSGPSLTVTMIQGGRTRNVVPDECTIAVDFRILPGMNGEAAVAELFESLDALHLSLSHGDFQCFAPALNTSADHVFIRGVVAICNTVLNEQAQPGGVPYGSDAGWVSELAPAAVLGPGDIKHAHAVDEFVEISQLVHCAEIYGQIVRKDWS